MKNYILIILSAFLLCDKGFAQNLSLSVNVTNAQCSNASNGAIYILPGGGSGQYNVSWQPNNLTFLDTVMPFFDATIMNLSGSTCYTVTVSDATLALSTSSVICVGAPPPIQILVPALAEIGPTSGLVLNLASNLLTLPPDTVLQTLAPSGGNGGTWCYTVPVVQSGLVSTPLFCDYSNQYKVTLADTFTFRVKDTMGCYKDTALVIQPAPPFSLQLDSAIALNCSDTCGRLQVRKVASAQSQALPYTVKAYASYGSVHLPDTNVGTLLNPIWRWNCLAADTYTIVAFDARKNWDSIVVTINDSMPLPGASYPLQFTFSGDDFGFAVTPDQSTWPGLLYSFSGPNVNILNSTNNYFQLNNLNTTYNTNVYTITIADVNGCSKTNTLSVFVYPRSRLNVKALLSGPYVPATGLMNDQLRSLNYLPVSNPYNQAPYNTVFPPSYTYQPYISSTVLSTTGPNAIVDWVLLQLRDKNNSANVIASAAALIQRDGDIVDVIDGMREVRLTTTIPDSYYVAVLHRNHLGVMTKTPLLIDEFTPLIDFTALNTPLYKRPDALNNYNIISPSRDTCTRIFNGVRALYGGNANISSSGAIPAYRFVRYNGVSNDALTLLSQLSGGTISISGYLKDDLNMNGTANYNGLNNDKLVILQNIGSPNLTIFSQLPN